MRMVYQNLYVGNEIDFESRPSFFNDWSVVHACKEPYHRNALGYKTRGAPKVGMDYYFVYDVHGHLILNIVDTNDPSFFADAMINEAVAYCLKGLKSGKKVLVHCNQGESRAPSIALLVLKRMGVAPNNFNSAVSWFRDKYPEYAPKQGIYEYIKSRWNND